MARKSKDNKEPEPGKPLDKEPEPATQPDGPSEEKGKDVAKNLTKGKGKGGGRGRRSNADIEQDKQDAIKRQAEEAQVESTCKMLAQSLPPTINVLCKQMEDTYKPALDALKNEYGVDQTFLLNDVEQNSIALTTEQILLRITPEWVAKYGVYAMIAIVGLQLFWPRYALARTCKQLMKPKPKVDVPDGSDDPSDSTQ